MRFLQRADRDVRRGQARGAESPGPCRRSTGCRGGAAVGLGAGSRRGRRRHMWIGLPRTAIAASLSASECVGWAWQV